MTCKRRACPTCAHDLLRLCHTASLPHAPLIAGKQDPYVVFQVFSRATMPLPLPRAAAAACRWALPPRNASPSPPIFTPWPRGALPPANSNPWLLSGCLRASPPPSLLSLGLLPHLQVGTVRQRSKTAKDGGTSPKWNERVPLGQLSVAGAPQLLVEVYAEKMGKGGCAA